MKVVVNDCFGSFGLSPLAIVRYSELYENENGQKLYLYAGNRYDNLNRVQQVTSMSLLEACLDDKEGFIDSPFFSLFLSPVDAPYLNILDESLIDSDDLERDDPLLVQVVEELGEKANTHISDLHILEIPDDVEWEISSYDGIEHVAEKHRVWTVKDNEW